MQLAVSLLGLTLASGGAKVTSPPQRSASKKHDNEGCWANHYVTEICCDGAWGGSGCWEDNRSYDLCCRAVSSEPPTPPTKSPDKVKSGSCRERLQDIVASLSSERIAARVANPVEAQIHQSLHDLANFTGPHLQRSSLTHLSGLTPFEREMLLALVKILAAIFEAAGITFWLHDSALRGALRHYGPEPWTQSLSLAVFAPTAEEITSALIAGAKVVEGAHKNTALGAFGPVVIAPAALKPNCGGNCGQWVVSFARGLTFRAASAEAGPRVPSVEVAWFDARGESANWRLYYGDPMPLAHRKILDLSLPVVRGRPFADLRLPIPRMAWKLQEILRRSREIQRRSPGEWRPEEVCQTFHDLGSHGDVSASSLPCAAMVAMFPMVLLRRSFASTTELLAELGLEGASSKRRKAIAASKSAEHRPRLSLSVEVSADKVRGASVLLVAEEDAEGSRGRPMTCWLPIHGSHVLINPVVVEGTMQAM